MSRTQRRDAAGADARPAAAEPPVEPLATGRHPARFVAYAVAAVAVLVSVTTPIDDYGIWQHLAVGRAIWQAHAVPTTHQWSWPLFGAPGLLPTWAFDALIWPFWRVAEVAGLFGWRWLVALATFGALWGAARRAGARGLAPLAVLVLAALTYRIRMRVGPETLAGLLLAFELWGLEVRRSRIARGPGTGKRLDPALGLLPIAWIWANTHDTYWIGLAVIAVYALDGGIAAWRARSAGSGAEASSAARAAGVLAAAGLGAVAVSFLHPFGWRALGQPLDVLLNGRDLLGHASVENLPVVWTATWRSGLPLLVLGWPLLLVWRARRSRPDWAEALLCAGFVTLAFGERRFSGFTAIVAAPFLARDLDAWIRARRWPSWTAAPVLQAAIAATACVAVGLLEWTRPQLPLGASIDIGRYPVAACDFMAEHGIRGRGFVPSSLGGYVLWRFWPDRERLPFMDASTSGTPEDRALYPYVFSNPGAWRTLDDRHHFDYVLLDGHGESGPGDRLLDVLDADSTWSLVFRDDAAALYVRPTPTLGPVAYRFGYLFLPGGDAGVLLLGHACRVDTTTRRLAALELERQIRASPANARAHSLYAMVAWIDHRPDDARHHLRAALETDPRTIGVHQRLGVIALAENRPEEAIREFRLELELAPPTGELYVFIGRGHEQLGNREQALEWYRKAIEIDPANPEARDAIGALERGAAAGNR